MIHLYHQRLRLDHLGKCLLRPHPNFSLATIWGVMHSHLLHTNATPQPATVAPSVSNAQNAPQKPKDVAVPDDSDDDEPDPDAGPSGHNGPPVLPLEDDEPFNPAPMPDDNPTPDESPAQEEEEEEEETDDTIPYGSTDTDETLDYNDLVIDDSQWCLLSQEQKLCSNTASFSVPRMIDGSLVAVGSIESSNAIGMSYSVISD